MAVETDGILLFPTCDPRNNSLIVRLLEQGVHVVCVDRYLEGVSVDAFVTDNYACTLESLRFLIRQRIYPIAHFTQGDLWVSSVRERYQAYLDAMREAGASSPEKWCRRFPVLNQLERASLTQLAADALVAMKQREPELKAVFCLNDYHLVAVLEACDELGWRVPGDLQILSFHDCVSLLSQTERRLHRLVQQPFELGKRAAERMLQYLKAHSLTPSVVRLPAPSILHNRNTHLQRRIFTMKRKHAFTLIELLVVIAIMRSWRLSCSQCLLRQGRRHVPLPASVT